MAAFRFSQLTFTCFIFVFLIRSIAAASDFSFSLSRFDPKLESNVDLYGDAKVVGDGNEVQLTGPVNSSAGRVIYKRPIKLSEGNPKKLVSFSTEFSFLMSPDNGDGLAFVMVPTGFNVSVFDDDKGTTNRKFKVVVVTFKGFRGTDYDNLVNNSVGIYVGSSASAVRSNDSSRHLGVNSWQKLHAWIDYEVGSRRLEVRMAKDDDLRPSEPLLSYPVNLLKFWDEEEVFVGLSSSNVNSSQTCFVYSWSFKLKVIPNWMHSQPLDPKVFAEKSKPLSVEEKKDCIMKVLAAMIFGTGCGALAAFIVLYLWTIFGSRRPVMPEEYAVRPVDLKYKKVEIVLDKAIEDGNKAEV